MLRRGDPPFSSIFDHSSFSQGWPRKLARKELDGFLLWKKREMVMKRATTFIALLMVGAILKSA